MCIRDSYDKDKKIDIFEKIFNKIIQVESDRKTVEIKLENNDNFIMKQFEEFDFRMKNHEKEMKQMVQNSQNII